MDAKYIWPLAGVFLGWILTTIAGGYRNRRDKKNLIGKLLPKLIRIDKQLQILISVSEMIKELPGDWEDYEFHRQRIVKRYLLEPDSIRSDLKLAIDDIAPHYPLLALELEDIYHLLLKTKSSNLTESSKSTKTYIYLLSAYEVGIDCTYTYVKKLIDKLAIKHSMLTYIKIKHMIRSRNRNHKNNESLAADILNEVKTELDSQPAH